MMSFSNEMACMKVTTGHCSFGFVALHCSNHTPLLPGSQLLKNQSKFKKVTLILLYNRAQVSIAALVIYEK